MSTLTGGLSAWVGQKIEGNSFGEVIPEPIKDYSKKTRVSKKAARRFKIRLNPYPSNATAGDVTFFVKKSQKKSRPRPTPTPTPRRPP